MRELAPQMVRTGTAKPAPEGLALRAGPVRVLYSDGDLRRICHGDVELVRRIYVAIRDLDWNTLSGEITDLTVADNGDSFAIRFTRRHTAGDLDYEWRAEIDGSTDGTIRYRMRGQALTAFPYAKIGICVHHPVTGYAGQPFIGSTPDGPVAGHLPDAIGPQIHLDDGTDLPLFEPVNDLTISHASGGQVRFCFSGDLWEMEDQRNWTDASYKSASTPAKLGYHHEASAGQVFDQSVETRAAGFPAAGRSAAADGPWIVTVGTAAGLVIPRPACGAPVRTRRLHRPAWPRCVPSPRRTCAPTCAWPVTRRQPTWPPPRSEPPSWAAGSNSRCSCRAATTRPRSGGSPRA